MIERIGSSVRILDKDLNKESVKYAYHRMAAEISDNFINLLLFKGLMKVQRIEEEELGYRATAFRGILEYENNCNNYITLKGSKKDFYEWCKEYRPEWLMEYLMIGEEE